MSPDAPDDGAPAPRDANRVLAALSADVFDRLRPHLEPCEMQVGEVIAQAGDPLTHVYFLQTGLLSMIASTASGSTVEVALVGNEGMAGAMALLGARTLPYGLVCQLRGRGWRARAGAIREELVAGDLLVFLHHYVQVVIAQITQAAVCNRFHSPRQRLSRWLAHMFDRTTGSPIEATHEFVAMMLGGARSQVTQASAELRDLGVIDYERGRVHQLNARGLREQACECYETVAVLLQPSP